MECVPYLSEISDLECNDISININHPSRKKKRIIQLGHLNILTEFYKTFGLAK